MTKKATESGVVLHIGKITIEEITLRSNDETGAHAPGLEEVSSLAAGVHKGLSRDDTEEESALDSNAIQGKKLKDEDLARLRRGPRGGFDSRRRQALRERRQNRRGVRPPQIPNSHQQGDVISKT